jgi:hypothetical protein
VVSKVLCSEFRCRGSAEQCLLNQFAAGVISAEESLNGKMTEQQNTFVCAFDLNSPRISAYEIHEWKRDMCLQENEVFMVQIDVPRRHVYINFCDINRRQCIPHLTKGQGEYRHANGELSTVRI